MLADVFVVLIVTFFVYTGYKAGLMKTLIKIVSYLLAFIVSLFLYPRISEFLMKTSLYTKIVDFINEKYIPSSGKAFENIEGLNFLTKYMEDGVETVATGIVGAVASLLINIIVFIVLLVLSRILIKILINLLGIFTKLPIIKQFNRLGGSVMGGIIGVFVLYVISALLILIQPLNSSQSVITKEIEKSVLASEICDNNIIIGILGKGN